MMDEKAKRRAQIKTDLQEVLGSIRQTNRLDGWPKSTISTKALKADVLEAVIYCGNGETDSVSNAPKVRNNPKFVHFVRKYGAGIAMQAVKEKEKSRVQIVLKFPIEI